MGFVLLCIMSADQLMKKWIDLVEISSIRMKYWWHYMQLELNWNLDLIELNSNSIKEKMRRKLVKVLKMYSWIWCSKKEIFKNASLKSSMPLSWILVWLVPLTQVWTHQNINSTKFESSRSFEQHQRHIKIPSTWIEW